jgi:NTP pyrophosphatase (non-canonical NTP hydrolase)
MSEVPYKQFVKTLMKPGADILETMTPHRVDLVHLAMGVSGEAGELLDSIKKTVIYGKSIDRENIVEELGDLKFYIRGIQNVLEISDSEIEKHNRAKLAKRYEGLTYTDKAAQERKDKENTNA